MADYYDQPTFGSVLDIIEQDAEITFQAVDYANFEAGKPFKSGELSIPETPNNRAILGSLFDADGSNKVRIIENATYQNDAISLGGSIVITGQTYQNRINILTGYFMSGNALLWLDFGDTSLRDLDWSAYEHLLNITNVQASEAGTLNDLIVYDLTDRGRYIDTDKINLIERYPAFNLAEMLRVIFKGYDVVSNFIAESWFTQLYMLFTWNNEIRNTDDWKETALMSGHGTMSQLETVNMFSSTQNINILGDYFGVVFTGTDEYDNGSNWDAVNGWYLVPETGTYRFTLSFSGAAYILNEFSNPPSGNVEYSQFEVWIKINNTYIAAYVYFIDADGSDNGGFTISPTTIDTDYLELQIGDKVSIHSAYSSRVTPPTLGVDWTYQSNISMTLSNNISRWYGYGSTVKPSEVLPDITVNEFLKMLFFHFAVTPQYSFETNIVRLDVFERKTSGHDLSYSLDPTTAGVDYGEAYNYELNFKPDTSDAYAEDWFIKNPDQTGNYEANNGRKVLTVLQSDFSNTIMQAVYRLDADRVPVPTMLSSIPEGTGKDRFLEENTPDWKTTFNYRIMVYDGVQSGQYKLGYHVAGTGRTVADVDYYVFKPYTDTNNIEFADRSGVYGLHSLLHKAYIDRINNGITLTIQGNVDVNYLNDLINCDADNNLCTPIYLNFEPFVGYYTVQKVTTTGTITQFTLIRNEE